MLKSNWHVENMIGMFRGCLSSGHEIWLSCNNLGAS